MASITEELASARTYMEIGVGMGADLVAQALLREIGEGRVVSVADVVVWVRDSIARLEEYGGC